MSGPFPDGLGRLEAGPTRPPPDPANPIEVCGRCGQVWPLGAMACPHCGAPAGFTPSPGRAERTRRPLPRWVREDWVRALACGVLSLLLLTAVCVLYGVALGLLAVGTDGGAVGGVGAGLLLPFAAYGAEVSYIATEDDALLNWVNSGMPLAVTAVAGVSTWLVLRVGLRRLADQPRRARQLVVKTAVVVALVLWIAGLFGDRGDWAAAVEQGDQSLLSSVSEVRGALGGFVVTLLAGAAALARAGQPVVRLRSPGVRRAVRCGRAGALAFGSVALVGALAGLVMCVVEADTTRDRFGAVASAPLALAGYGAGGSAVMHGGAAATTNVEQALTDRLSAAQAEDGGALAVTFSDLDPQDVQACNDQNDTSRARSTCLRNLLTEARENRDTSALDAALRDAYRISPVPADTHVSLFDWRLPHTDETGRAPWWAWCFLLVPAVGVCGATWRLLQRAAPPSRDWALRLAAMVAVGYALASWLLALLAPLGIAASGSAVDADGLSLLLRPDVQSSLGLPLLWAAVGALVTAVVWTRHTGRPGSLRPHVAAAASPTYAPGVATPAADLLADPRSTGPASWSPRCRACGARYAPDASFCSSCGRPAGV